MSNISHKPNQANILIGFVEKANLFHTADGKAYVDVFENEYRKTYIVQSRIFEQWLAKRFYEETSNAPSPGALKTAINSIEAMAKFEGEEREVFFRIGKHDEKIYFDLGDEKSRVVEIDDKSWRLIDNPPVRFRRTAEMKPLPAPAKVGKVDELKKILNIKSEDDFVLVRAWLQAVLRGEGPYPVLVLSGEQGSAKSTFSEILRTLLDPNKPPSRPLPKNTRDLFVSAERNHILVFDNVSKISPDMSDAICRLSTGGAYATRQAWREQDETIFEACRPIIFNGITDFVNRPDLADRAIFIELDPINEDRRRTKGDIWKEFEAARPRILNGLFQDVSRGLKRLPKIKLPKMPRMADFAKWAEACEGGEKAFGESYERNNKKLNESVVENDIVASTIVSFMESISRWEGTMGDLLEKLETELKGAVEARELPSSPTALSNKMRRISPILRREGVQIFRDEKRRRLIIMKNGNDDGSVSIF